MSWEVARSCANFACTIPNLGARSSLNRPLSRSSIKKSAPSVSIERVSTVNLSSSSARTVPRPMCHSPSISTTAGQSPSRYAFSFTLLDCLSFKPKPTLKGRALGNWLCRRAHLRRYWHTRDVRPTSWEKIVRNRSETARSGTLSHVGEAALKLLHRQSPHP